MVRRLRTSRSVSMTIGGGSGISPFTGAAATAWSLNGPDQCSAAGSLECHSQSRISNCQIHVQDGIDDGATLRNGGAVGGGVLQGFAILGPRQLHTRLKEIILKFLGKVGTGGAHDCTSDGLVPGGAGSKAKGADPMNGPTSSGIQAGRPPGVPTGLAAGGSSPREYAVADFGPGEELCPSRRAIAAGRCQAVQSRQFAIQTVRECWLQGGGVCTELPSLRGEFRGWKHQLWGRGEVAAAGRSWKLQPSTCHGLEIVPASLS
jgi:hypothetical protein